MGQTLFSKPVSLSLHRADKFEARTPLEALDYLNRYWPAGRAVHYRRALALCEAAAAGRASSEDAYRALVDAARRAGLLVYESRASEHFDPAGEAVAFATRWPGRLEADEDVSDADLAGYLGPADILADASLPIATKRALLAHWASDIHAVPGSPSLRSVKGVTATIDSIFEALNELDLRVDPAASSQVGPGTIEHSAHQLTDRGHQ
jgi:hypothetical protein